MANQALSKQDWATTAVAHIKSTPENAELFEEALKAAAAQSGAAAPRCLPFELLAWLRGDEPQDAYESGDSPVDYADFLTTEWDLYGPEGE